jgi:hypothetical protein
MTARDRRMTLAHFAKMKRELGSAWVKWDIQAKRSVIRNCVDNQQKPFACKQHDVANYLRILDECERRFATE